MRTSIRMIGVVAAVGLLAGACTSGGSDVAGTATTTETTAAESATTSKASTTTQVDDSALVIDFEPCGGGSECALVEVPLDYDKPGGEKTSIHVTRRQATGERIGNMFLNPGGPGGSTEDMVKGIGEFGYPDIAEQFDLIGIDPRGTGKSGAVNCNPDWENDSTYVITFEDGLKDDVDSFIEDFSEMADACEGELGVDYLASITTENAARDMEQIRIALGDENLTYLGYSYGTALGSTYATLFPNTIRAMVLDGAVPNNPSETGATGLAQRLEEALLRLDRSCELWTDCPANGVGLLNAMEQVEDELMANGNIGPLEPHTYESAAGAIVGLPYVLTGFAPALMEALEGNGQPLHELGTDFLTPLPDGGYDSYSGAHEAIVCADGWALDAGTKSGLLNQAEKTSAAHPIIGPVLHVPCDLWPVTGDGIPEANYTGSAPILVVGNTYDPITPLAWSRALADELGPEATLLTWDGSNHTVALSFEDRCVDDKVIGFLVDLAVPEAGTVCPLRGLIGIGYDGEPVIIDRVTPGSPAEAAGVEVGDRIVEVDGVTVLSSFDVSEGGAGSTMEMVLYRADETVLDRAGETIELSIVRGFPDTELWRLDN